MPFTFPGVNNDVVCHRAATEIMTILQDSHPTHMTFRQIYAEHCRRNANPYSVGYMRQASASLRRARFRAHIHMQDLRIQHCCSIVE